MVSTPLPIISKGGGEKEHLPILRLLIKVRLLNPVCLGSGIKACVYVEKNPSFVKSESVTVSERIKL